MDSLVRKGWERLRDRFAALVDQGHKLGCVLVEHHGYENFRDDLPPSNLEIRGGHSYRSMTLCEPSVPQYEPGKAYFTDRLSYDAAGTPITNTAGIPFAFLPLITRGFYMRGTQGASELYWQLAEDAGRACGDLPRHLLGLLPAEVLRARRECERWTCIVYELAWMRPKGGLLPPAEKMVWIDNSAMPMQMLNTPSDWPDLDEKYPEDRWFAEIPDILSASLGAIDLLLHVWDTVPDGWYGIEAPSSLSGLRTSLQAARLELNQRSETFPEFANADHSTRFQDVPARYWWPYVEFWRDQLRTITWSIVNTAAWLRAHGYAVNEGPSVDHTTPLAEALEAFDAREAWVDHVTRTSMAALPVVSLDESPEDFARRTKHASDLYAAMDRSAPWYIRCLNPVAIAAAYGPTISADRVGVLLRQISDDARQHPDADFTTLGTWATSAIRRSTDERQLLTAFLKSIAEDGYNSVCDLYRTAFPRTVTGTEFGEPTVDSEHLMQSLAWLVNAISPVLWDVPEIEWRHLGDDFQPFYPAPVMSHRPFNHQGTLVELRSPILVHRPKGSRTTPSISAAAWQAWETLRKLREAYRNYHQEIRKHWPYGEERDPVEKFLDDPGPKRWEACRRFLDMDRFDPPRPTADERRVGDDIPPAKRLGLEIVFTPPDKITYKECSATLSVDQWRGLEAMVGTQSLSDEQFITAAKGDHAAEPTAGKLQGLVKRINDGLLMVYYPRSLGQKGGYIVWK